MAIDPEDVKKRFETLTSDQKDIVKLVCEGLSARDIAVKLHSTEGTVKTNMSGATGIYKKLGVVEADGLKQIEVLRKYYCPILFEAVKPPPPPPPPPVTVRRGLGWTWVALLLPLAVLLGWLLPHPPQGDTIIQTRMVTQLVEITTTPGPIGTSGVTQLPPVTIVRTVLATVEVPVTQIVVVTATPPPPTFTPEISSTPTETATPTATPTLSIVLPFDDPFNVKPESAPWRVISGDSFLSDGQLHAVGEQELVLEIGDDSLSNYTVALDFILSYVGVDLILDERLKLNIHNNSFTWYRKVSNGDWQQINNKGFNRLERNRVTLVILGNSYEIFVNGQSYYPFSFGEQIYGPLKVVVHPNAVMDNFHMELTTP